MQKYRDWDILESMPDGWAIDKTAGSPLARHVFITNKKSVFNGQKRALLKVCDIDKGSGINISDNKQCTAIIKNIEPEKPKKEHLDYSKELNILARKKFQQKMLADILIDLTVCEIEGWCKKQYIKELQKLIGGIDLSKKASKNQKNQNTLFDL